MVFIVTQFTCCLLYTKKKASSHSCQLPHHYCCSSEFDAVDSVIILLVVIPQKYYEDLKNRYKRKAVSAASHKAECWLCSWTAEERLVSYLSPSPKSVHTPLLASFPFYLICWSSCLLMSYCRVMLNQKFIFFMNCSLDCTLTAWVEFKLLSLLVDEAEAMLLIMKMLRYHLPILRPSVTYEGMLRG